MTVLPPPAILAFPAAVVGLVMGSFVTALSYRAPRAESVARGRSKCPSCGHVLGVRDLVPVLSWVASRGACRYCGAPVSWRYPVIELATMALFVAGVWCVKDAVALAIFAAMTVIMMALAVIDLEQQRLPNGLLLGLLAGVLAWRWSDDRDLAGGIAAAAVVFALGVLINAAFRAIARKPGLGLGDSKLLAIAAVGLPVGPLLLFLSGAGVLGVGFGLFWRWRRGSSLFPFGPPILMAYWLSLAAGGPAVEALIRHLSATPS